MSHSTPQTDLPAGDFNDAAPRAVAEAEAPDIGLQDALDTLTAGVDDSYGGRGEAIAAINRALADVAGDTAVIRHEGTAQPIWRYGHDAEDVRRQIETTIDRYFDEDDHDAERVVAMLRIAAARLDPPITEGDE
jgi:hypothetical protein